MVLWNQGTKGDDGTDSLLKMVGAVHLCLSLSSQALWVRRISDGGKGSIQRFIH